MFLAGFSGTFHIVGGVSNPEIRKYVSKLPQKSLVYKQLATRVNYTNVSSINHYAHAEGFFETQSRSATNAQVTTQNAFHHVGWVELNLKNDTF